MRVELKEMEQMNVAGGQVKNTVYKKSMNVTVEHALMDSTKSALVVPLGKQPKTSTKTVKSTTYAYC